MRPLTPDIKKIATVSAIVFLSLFCVWLLLAGADTDTILKAAAKSGVILFILGVFWTYFNASGWRRRPLRLWGWLSIAPDLHGRWEGMVCRNKNDAPHPFVLEVSQTFTSLSFRTFSRNSFGESITATVFVDQTSQIFKVYAIWRVTTRKIGEPTSEDTFYGTSDWNISFDAGKKILVGTYFTSREPQTKGALTLEWKSRTLVNRFL